MFVPPLYSSTHGSRSPKRSVMPLVPRKKLFGRTSFNQSGGKAGRLTRVELAKPGV